MKFSEKLYWKIKNFLQAAAQNILRGGSGLLDEKPDPRDRIFLGGGVRKPKMESLVLSNDWRFDQKSLNICVFASAAMGASYQEDIRFSAKFYVKLAKKLGMISGNGYSYLRAARKISAKYGRLPYEYMPDEVNESWASYSKWDITQEQLDIAEKYKIEEYRKIETPEQVLEALESGYVLFTANKWYSEMNYPTPPEFLLRRQGVVSFGHAWPSTGYEAPEYKFKKYRVTNSYGADWAVNGEAFITSLFGQDNYSIYVESFLPETVKVEYYLDKYNNKAVKGKNPPIYLLNGKKKYHIPTMEIFSANFTEFATIPDYILDAIPEGGTYS